MRYQRGIQLLLALVLVTLGFSTAPAAFAADERCFQETGFCISGRFRQYWEQNGGLAVFGYPLEAAHEERNRDTGQIYLTQWFQRNRFELHGDLAAPYDVLLGRLGDDSLRKQGRDWQLEPRESGPKQGCLWFEQTGHNICDQAANRGFRNYWLTHGLLDPKLDTFNRSLALFGMPLTEPTMVTNSSGDTVLTQIFERARFEWHPDKPEPYTVLLGLLGTELRGPGTVGPALLSSQAVNNPIGAGNYLFWLEKRSGDPALVAYNAAQPASFIVAEHVNAKTLLASDGRSLIWQQAAGNGSEIVFFDIASRKARTIVKNIALAPGLGSIAIDGDTIFYTDTAEGHSGIFAHIISSNEEYLVSETGSGLVARDGKLLWSETTTTGTGTNQRTSLRLHLRLLSQSEDRDVTVTEPLAGPAFFSGYDVLGDHVVWSIDTITDKTRVSLYRISDGSIRTISKGAASAPKLAVGNVVWATHPFYDGDANPNHTWMLVRYSLNDGTTAQLTDPQPTQSERPVAIASAMVATVLYNAKADTGLRNVLVVPL